MPLMTDDLFIPKRDETRAACPACGVPWTDHLGVQGTCAKEERYRRMLEQCLNVLASDERYDPLACEIDRVLIETKGT